MALAPLPGNAQTPAPPQKPAAAQPAPGGQAPQGTSERFGSWILGCPAPPQDGTNAPCLLAQQVSEALSRKVVFVWLVQYDDKGALLGAFRLPPGVFVNRGLIMKTDANGDGLRVDYTRCDPQECQAVFSISPELVKQLSAAKQVTVDIALTNGQTANVQLGMDGFAAAMAALAARAKGAQ